MTSKSKKLLLEIVDAKTQKRVCEVDKVEADDSVFDVKFEIFRQKKHLHPERQSLRLAVRGKDLPDETNLGSLELLPKGGQLFLKDLGPQIGWKTVFVLEYLGPLLLYPLFYLRPGFVYESAAARTAPVVSLACVCWVAHYLKRVLETLFVHRFSHGTMPVRNLFKNCSYYWGFAAFVAFYVNHPLYTPPMFGPIQVFAGLVGFIIGELGNMSIHLALRNLRPAGSKERRIPVPTANPFTRLFDLVSCPNYTYETLAWVSFAMMTQCLPALIFAGVGFVQMAVWALAKHRNYKKEFDDYPTSRVAILPFIL